MAGTVRRGWVRFGGGKRRGFSGLRVRNGFVRHFGRERGAEGDEAFELLDGAAVVALSLGLVAQEERPGVGAAGKAVEAGGQGEVAVLGADDFDIAIANEFPGHGRDGVTGPIEGLIEAGGEEAGFEAGGAEHGLLGEGDAFEGEEFLGVGGLVDGREVVAEAGDFIELFETHDGKGGGGEAVFAGVLSGAGLAFEGARSGGAGGVGAVGGELFGGDGFARHDGAFD